MSRGAPNKFQQLDVSESVMEVLKDNKKNRSLTETFFQETHRETLRQRTAAIDELHSQLQLIPKEEIEKTLELFKWSVEEAIVPLMEKFEELRSKIKETNPAAVSLTTESDRVDTGQPIKVNFKAQLTDELTSLSSRCWIGLYKINSQNKKYITYNWADFKGKDTGQVTFYAPTEFGAFEFKFFYGDKGYQHAVTSAPFQVGPVFTAEARIEEGKIQVKAAQISGNVYSRAWIGLYEKDQPNYIEWDWFKTQIQFNVPAKKGIYELRVFSYRYEQVATSAPFQIL